VKKQLSFPVLVGLITASLMVWSADSNTARAQSAARFDFVAPTVYQASGPTSAAIQGVVDLYRAALGVNNLNAPGPLASGRREINWDGGGSTATSPAPTPFTGFQLIRGAVFTTPGTGFVQAPTSGLAATFANPTYETAFQPFSPVRLFSPVGSNITDVDFSLPGFGDVPATTSAFGAVFSDVDGRRLGRPRPATQIEYFDADGKLLYASAVPASPGTATFSFLGIIYSDARIAHVRIRTGDNAPGPDETLSHDIVMMDDFIFGEPKAK
jgi:hypothetical protein